MTRKKQYALRRAAHYQLRLKAGRGDTGHNRRMMDRWYKWAHRFA